MPRNANIALSHRCPRAKPTFATEVAAPYREKNNVVYRCYVPSETEHRDRLYPDAISFTSPRHDIGGALFEEAWRNRRRILGLAVQGRLPMSLLPLTGLVG